MKNKITKNVEYVQINFADNGYIVEYSGESSDGDWHNVKSIISDFDELIEYLQVVVEASKYRD